MRTFSIIRERGNFPGDSGTANVSWPRCVSTERRDDNA